MSVTTSEKTDSNANNDRSIDKTLNEIRSGRRLGRLVSSIESFLLSQITRLEQTIDECDRAVQNDQIVQNVLIEFENEKKNWEQKRQAEIERLQLAGEELAKGWKELEDERRRWMDERGN